MTGFSRAQVEDGAYAAEVELRSVNHRYLELHVRLPSSLAPLEMKIRQAVAARLGRGKVDVSVYLTPQGESPYRLEVDRALLGQFAELARSLGSELRLGGELRLSDLLGFQQAFNLRERDLASGEEAWKVVALALERALGELEGMRQAEGQELAADLERRMARLAATIGDIEKIAESGAERKRKELAEKVAELTAGVSLDPSVVAMEVARLVERSDIAEELTRFRSHLALWKDTVASGQPCGKKLDFIVQEMNREANTIGSKCQESAITERVIAIKTELERAREQIQNVE